MKKHFKSLFCLALSICLAASSLLAFAPASAAEATTVSQETTNLDNGDYCVVTLEETTIPSMARYAAKKKAAKKTYKYYNANNVFCWSYTLNATFMYDGTLVVCTDVSHTIYVENIKSWIYDSGKRWKEANSAYGKATFHLIGSNANKTVNLKITSTKHGVIS